MLTFPYSYNWQKFHNKMNKKRNQEYRSMGPEYVTGQINSRILELFLDDFAVLFLHCLENLNMLQPDKAFSKRPKKTF